MTIVFVHPATLLAAGNVAIVLDMQGARPAAADAAAAAPRSRAVKGVVPQEWGKHTCIF